MSSALSACEILKLFFEGDWGVMLDALLLVRPGIVPIKLLTRLERADVHTTDQVHQHIRSGTLQTLPGIGSRTECEILKYYTRKAVAIYDWSNGCGGMIDG